MSKFNIGEIWWTHFQYQENETTKRRPAIIVDGDNLAIMTMYVTSQNNENPYSIYIENWKTSGLPRPSWMRIDRIIKLSEMDIDSKIGELSGKDLDKFLQLTKESLAGISHDFLLLALRNSEGKYLLKYDKRWHCWLFPWARENDANKDTIDNLVEQLVGKPINTNYSGMFESCKFSKSDSVYKIYKYKLYSADISDESCSALGNDYCWMSIGDMKNDSTIMSVNYDVVSFVEKSISK